MSWILQLEYSPKEVCTGLHPKATLLLYVIIFEYQGSPNVLSSSRQDSGTAILQTNSLE